MPSPLPPSDPTPEPLPSPTEGPAGVAEPEPGGAPPRDPPLLGSVSLGAPATSGRSLSLPARLEAILYLKGRPLSLAELSCIASVDSEQVEMGLITLMADYAHRDTALEIHQEADRYSLQLRDGHGDLVQDLLPVDLSTAALRTLATIALKRRILQSALVELRGSGAYDHIRELLAQDFIERRRQSDGRSFWLSLSEKFHRTFSVRPEDLPRRRSAAAAAPRAAAEPGAETGGGSPPGAADDGPSPGDGGDGEEPDADEAAAA